MTNPIPEQRESWDDMAGTDYDDADIMERDDQNFDNIDPSDGCDEDDSEFNNFDDCEFEDDGQPTMYEEYQDLYGGDDQFDGHLDSGDGW